MRGLIRAPGANCDMLGGIARDEPPRRCEARFHYSVRTRSSGNARPTAVVAAALVATRGHISAPPVPVPGGRYRYQYRYWGARARPGRTAGRNPPGALRAPGTHGELCSGPFSMVRITESLEFRGKTSIWRSVTELRFSVTLVSRGKVHFGPRRAIFEGPNHGIVDIPGETKRNWEA